MRHGCLAAVAIAPVLLAGAAMLPAQRPVTTRPASETAQLPPCPVSHPARHLSKATGTAETVSVTVPALPGLNCR